MYAVVVDEAWVSSGGRPQPESSQRGWGHPQILLSSLHPLSIVRALACDPQVFVERYRLGVLCSGDSRASLQRGHRGLNHDAPAAAKRKLAKRGQEIVTPTPESSRQGTPKTASSATGVASIDADASPQREKSPTPVSNKRKTPGATPGAIIAAYEARGIVRATPATITIPGTPLSTQRGRMMMMI